MEGSPSEVVNGQKDIIVEIGPGNQPGRSMADLSEDVKSRLQKGALYVAVDADRWSLEHVAEGAAAHMSLQDFAASMDTLNGKARTIFIGNVVSAPDFKLSSTETARAILGIAHKKLAPDGNLIIIENLAPDQSAFLKTIPYDQFGLTAEISEGQVYRRKLQQLKMKETPAAEEVLWRTGSPFIIELKLTKKVE